METLKNRRPSLHLLLVREVDDVVNSPREVGVGRSALEPLPSRMMRRRLQRLRRRVRDAARVRRFLNRRLQVRR